jgi:hypothetical protein
MVAVTKRLVPFILPTLIVIILVVFIVLTYMEFERTKMNEYNQSITWSCPESTNILQENENTYISTTLSSTPIPMILTSTHIEQKPFFIKHPKTKDLVCDRLYGNDSKRYIENLILANYIKSRITYTDEEDCESIKKRNYFPTKPRTEFEARFPLAFARIVNYVSSFLFFY